MYKQVFWNNCKTIATDEIYSELSKARQKNEKCIPPPKNDIINIFGPPSTKSTFDNKVWIYIERKKTNRSIFKLGNQKIEKNNVVVLEINKKGILSKKEIYDIANMSKYEFSKKKTSKKYGKDSYIYGVLSSLRDKIDAPIRRQKSKK